MCPGDVYMLNAPYNGGTHIPDVTVITPVFSEADHAHAESEAGRKAAAEGAQGGREAAFEKPQFFVASRGHHSEIGGISPGSMPPFSRSIEEEGILIDNFQVSVGWNLASEWQRM